MLDRLGNGRWVRLGYERRGRGGLNKGENTEQSGRWRDKGRKRRGLCGHGGRNATRNTDKNYNVWK